MGAEYVERSLDACSEKELKAWFKQKVQIAQQEYGNRGYTGSWAEKDSIEVSSKTFLTSREASLWLADKADKWGAALAVKVGDFSKQFPETAADKALLKRLEESRQLLDFFDFDILTRTREQKSEKKGCTGCGSSINVKKMWAPTRTEYEVALRATHTGSEPLAYRFRDGLYFVALQRLTACPVCGHDFMRTESDSKRKAALEKKVKELTDKVAAARSAYERKHADLPVKPHWVVGAWCSC